jgi:Uma2 family endonuclease
MNPVDAKQTYTPEDLLAMPGGDDFELVGGALVERSMGWQSSRIGGRLFGYLFSFCEAHGAGWVAPADAGYQCFADDPGKVRKPDASFIRLERLPAQREPQGHCPIAPDVAVEVVSPHDLFSDVEVKVDEYLRAGVSLVWVIDPATRTVRVHRQEGSVSYLHEDDQLDGESVLPGFSCPVRNLFQSPGAHTDEPRG